MGKIIREIESLGQKRRKTFQKTVEIKSNQKKITKKLNQNLVHLDRLNLSTSGFEKITKKSIQLIQNQRGSTIKKIKKDVQKIDEISKKLTSTENNYLLLSSKNDE